MLVCILAIVTGIGCFSVALPSPQTPRITPAMDACVVWLTIGNCKYKLNRWIFGQSSLLSFEPIQTMKHKLTKASTPIA